MRRRSKRSGRRLGIIIYLASARHQSQGHGPLGLLHNRPTLANNATVLLPRLRQKSFPVTI